MDENTYTDKNSRSREEEIKSNLGLNKRQKVVVL